MKIIDISMPVSHDMPVYKGRENKRPVIETETDFTKSAVYETRISLNLHTGTHIDCPLHIFEGGSTVEQLDLNKVVTKCKVFDFIDAEGKISRKHLESKPIDEGDFIILKTRNSVADILEGEYIYVDKSGAEYLKDKKISGVGIDSLGIERAQPGHETHKLLLGSGIVILEGLRLADANEGEYLLVAAPMLITGAEAAPARALLLLEV